MIPGLDLVKVTPGFGFEVETKFAGLTVDFEVVPTFPGLEVALVIFVVKFDGLLGPVFIGFVDPALLCVSLDPLTVGLVLFDLGLFVDLEVLSTLEDMVVTNAEGFVVFVEFETIRVLFKVRVPLKVDLDPLLVVAMSRFALC